ncbi:MAG: alkaline phosphatase family protein, partial [Armatimonadota bacterium]|nr:alkaline phosphatase family protein [Armatimonadota bacterium]
MKRTLWRRRKVAALCALAALLQGIAPAGAQSPKHNAIIVVADGLRAGSVNPTDAPTMHALEKSGVRFANSHSLFPTFTTLNASAIATGHAPGDTGDFSNNIFTGYPLFGSGTVTPFLENDPTLADIDEHFGGNYLTEETLLACARHQGFNTAAVGKQGPTLIQDVTQGNRDSVSGTVPPPTTIIIDDSTGRPTGVPLRASVTAALARAGLSATAPNRANGAAANSPQSNGFSGSSTVPGTRAANVVQQQYFTSAITGAILPAFKNSGKPFVIVYWSRDPDGTQHNQGDSLNKLTPGINGPTAHAAIRNVDNNLAQILAVLKRLNLDTSTDIFVTADHGFNTISKHELNAAGNVTASAAARQTYPGVPTGFLPPGFLAIDLARALN